MTASGERLLATGYLNSLRANAGDNEVDES